MLVQMLYFSTFGPLKLNISLFISALYENIFGVESVLSQDNGYKFIFQNDRYVYGRNQSGCEKAKKNGIFTLYTLDFLDHLHFCCFDENYHVF